VLIASPIGGWHTGKMPASRRRPDVSWLPTVAPSLERLLAAGHATKGLHVTARAGHLVVGRTNAQGADPRFRLTPLGGGAYGLSLYRRQRWEPLPFQGTLQELAETMDHELSPLGRTIGRNCAALEAHIPAQIGSGTSGILYLAFDPRERRRPPSHER
jgi:hypothetical protein